MVILFCSVSGLNQFLMDVHQSFIHVFYSKLAKPVVTQFMVNESIFCNRELNRIWQIRGDLAFM